MTIDDLNSTARNVYRDFAIDGVPASGTHEPEKPGIRAFLSKLLQYVQAVGAVSVAGERWYATKEGMDADLAHAAGSTAIVWNDTDVEDNAIYNKVGAAGTGSWVKVAELADIFSTVAAEAAANAAAGFAADAELARDEARESVANPMVYFDTLSALSAALGYDANTVAQVDADGANNGTYRKVGASGAGSWEKKSNATVPGLDAGLSGEIADRKALIRTSSAGLTVIDESGFVVLRATPDLMSLMGALTFGELFSPGFNITDDAGFSLLHVSPDDIRWMGRSLSESTPVDVTAALPGSRRDLDSVFRPGNRSLAKYRQGRAKAIQGLGRARVVFLGDSNIVGHGALGTGVHSRRLSTPDTTARLLPSAYGATRANVAASMITGNGTDPSYDPRFTAGSGWGVGGPVTVGGTMWQNSTTTAEIEFSPEVAWDTAEVWVAIDSSASLQIGVSGSMASHSPATGSIVKLTYTAPTLAAQMFRIARVSGTVRIIAWDCFKAGEGMSIINGGRSGTRSDQIADATTWYSPRPAVLALAPDLVVIQTGLNDIAQGVLPATYKGHVETLTDACLGAGIDVVLTVPMHPSEPRTYPWSSYVTAIYEVAEARSLCVIDISSRLGAYPESNAAGWQADTLHPNATGYAESAILHAQLLTF
ncbi:MAG: SGNH/GDSL hydrolase family protein [Beijerinckiaceae bacterium]|nr:SGNH/GDSL hydrolase family protein [Beijerinckiaceae bacterium]